MRVLPVAGGWIEVLDLFSQQSTEMDRWPYRFMILLIDFDGNFEGRLAKARERIPEHLHQRVFVIGTLSEPEALRRAGLGTYEQIGAALANDCRNETESTWGHVLLRHNAGELARMRSTVRSILFQS
jgi:hypothetical protein